MSELSRQYRQSNHNKFFILDVCVFIFIFLNLGAVMLTNAMVVKARPTTELVEANPINVEYKQSPNIVLGLILIFKNLVLRGVLVFLYIFFRNKVHNEDQYNYFAAITIGCGAILTFDFFNNLGYYLGKVFYGSS